MILFVTGVSGTGKTTIGKKLAKALGYAFIDADDHHPASNVEKMSQGIPLTDTDRLPWLKTLNHLARESTKTGCVIACSALKTAYRKVLAGGIPSDQIRWFALEGSKKMITDRMQARNGHFMPPALLQSQLETWEPLERHLTFDISASPDELISEIMKLLQANNQTSTPL